MRLPIPGQESCSARATRPPSRLQRPMRPAPCRRSARSRAERRASKGPWVRARIRAVAGAAGRSRRIPTPAFRNPRRADMRSLMLVALFVLPGMASAQSWGPRTLEELKQETLRRAERKWGPIAGIRTRAAGEARAGLASLEPDEWAAAWSRVGERHLRAGDAYQAWRSFNVARWPSEKLSPGKQRAYERALEAFQRYARSLTPPIETVRIPFEGSEVVAYLRLPQGTRPAPLVFGINGLDSRKEEVIARGVLDRPSAPMLLVNGERDTQQPIADLYLLMKHGDPKDVWVNPEGGHMGRSERWPDGRVLAQVVEPWVLRRLGAAP